MHKRSVLIAGAGVAGPTLAYWLARGGVRPTLVERAPALRTGGYVVDFCGLGYDVAERMGLTDAIRQAGYFMRETRFVDDSGRTAAGFGGRIFDQLTGGRYVTVARSELARLLFDRAHAVGCETLFGDEIVALDEVGDGVDVTFAHGGHRRFDLVVGADGLHSGLRKLVFGAQEKFERPLGYRVAAFESAGYRPREDLAYVIYSKPGRMIARLALRDDRTLFLFVYADAADAAPHDADAQRAGLHRTFGADGWEARAILAALDRADDLYADPVSQIRMDAWSKGRVALVGDAAFCASLVAGQGTALAMTAAYVLAGELARAQGRYAEAFAAYEARLRPYIEGKQAAALRFADWFAPKTSRAIFLRNLAIKMFRIPGLAKWLVGRDIAESMALPEYGEWLGRAQ